MSQGFTLDHRWLPLEKLTGEYAEQPAPKPVAPPAPAPLPVPTGYCAHCHEKLPRRTRAGALYCSDAHRKAASRRSAAIAEANMAFKADLSIAENNRRAAALSGEYSYFASLMSCAAKRDSLAATFWETPNGVLVTEDIPGAAMLAMSTRFFSDFGRYDWRFEDSFRIDPWRSTVPRSQGDRDNQRCRE